MEGGLAPLLSHQLTPQQHLVLGVPRHQIANAPQGLRSDAHGRELAVHSQGDQHVQNFVLQSDWARG